MGKSNSKTVENSGDPQVIILNQLEAHAEMHVSHEQKLIVIMIVVILQFAMTLYVIYRKHTRKEALKAAKSMATLQV